MTASIKILLSAFFLSVELYMSPVETWCHNINYYIPDEEGETKNFNMEMMARIRKFFFTFAQVLIKVKWT